MPKKNLHQNLELLFLWFNHFYLSFKREQFWHTRNVAEPLSTVVKHNPSQRKKKKPDKNDPT